MDTGRRRFLRDIGLAGVGTLLASCAGGTRAEPERIYRIGYLSKAGSHVVPAFESFRKGLREQGFVEGKNLFIDERFPEGGDDELRATATDLVEQKVDLIVARCSPETKAAKHATQTVPIVMIALTGDPVGSGVVSSIARPGGNVTGLTVLAPQLSGKRVEVLKEAYPGVSRLAVLYNASIPENADDLREMESAARSLGVELQVVSVKTSDEIDRAVATALQGRPQAITTLMGTLGTSNRAAIVAAQTRNALPAVYEVREFVDVGGVMSYGPSLREIYSRAASYVAKILRGAKPADLPVERPTRFELVVNLRTAKSLGIALPQSVLAQAAEIVQ